jgi:trk system potassium uptake protein TrkA
MNFVVIGCGRVGSELAYKLFTSGHQVVVVDSRKESFNRLPGDFRGRTIEGMALAKDTLDRANLENCDGVAVVTNMDTLNAVVGHTIRTYYPSVKQVVVRNYDPAMRKMLETFNLQMVSSTAWGAERLQEILIDPNFRAVFSAGNGEVELYEITIASEWNGRAVAELTSSCKVITMVALTRAGRAYMPNELETFQTGDILTVSATLDGITALRNVLQGGKTK